MEKITLFHTSTSSLQIAMFLAITESSLGEQGRETQRRGDGMHSTSIFDPVRLDANHQVV